MSGPDERGSVEEISGRQAAVALAYIALLVMLPSLITGPPFGQSYFFNLNWYECFSEQFWSGEVYPRWLAGLWGGAGAADFFFYGPLPFYLASLTAGLCVGCEPETSYVVGFTLIHFLSGLSFLVFARGLVPLKIALIGSIAYLIVPFHVGDSWFLRQAAGEFLAFAMLPLVVHFFRLVLLGGRYGGVGLALAVAGLGLSHLPSLVTTAGFIGIATLGVLGTRRTPWRERCSFVVRLGLWWGLGMCLVAFYWVPALMLLNDVSPGHFYLEHLLWENWLFFDGKPEPFESYYGNELKRYLLLSTAFIGLVVWKGNQFRGRLLPWVIVPLVTTWFFVTPLSWPAWAYLPVLEKIQLPYRFFYIYDFGLATTIMMLASVSGEQRWRRYGVGLVLFCWLGTDYHSATRVDTSYLPEDAWPWLNEARASRFGPAEYLSPAGVEKGILLKKEREELAEYMSLPQVVVIPEQELSASLQQESSRRYSLKIAVDAASVVTLKKQYWEHWVVNRAETGESLAVRPSMGYGLMQFELAPGVHEIEFTLPVLQEEWYGYLLSFCSLLSLLGLGLRERRRLIQD